MWTSYSARHAAQLIGLPESAVRSCIRDGLVGTPGAVPAQLSFRDLSALRTVKALVDAGLPLGARAQGARARSSARCRAARRSPSSPSRRAAGRSTCAARDDGAAAAGQLALPFVAPVAAASEPPGELRELPRAPDAPVPVAVPPATADQWLQRAHALEERDPVAAIDAYRRSLRLRPDCTEAWINLGRMFAESGDGEAARDCFHSALELDPADATAHYNLGVLAQDAGKEAEAIDRVPARARARPDSSPRRTTTSRRCSIRPATRAPRSGTSTSIGS